MKLSTARLCLDCNDVYDEAVCPGCGSETFAFLSRWVPTADQRPQPRPVDSPAAEAYRGLLAPAQSRTGRHVLVGGALLGAAAVGMLGWIWQSSKPKSENESTTGQPSSTSDEKTNDM